MIVFLCLRFHLQVSNGEGFFFFNVVLKKKNTHTHTQQQQHINTYCLGDIAIIYHVFCDYVEET